MCVCVCVCVCACACACACVCVCVCVCVRVRGLDYFLFQLFSELCFPTWLFTFSQAVTEIRDASTVALSCCRNPSLRHQTVGSPDTPTLWHTDKIPTLKNYDKYTLFPRTIIHWNALCEPGSAFVPLSIRFCFYLSSKLIPFSHCKS